jgi:hypothetical protein
MSVSSLYQFLVLTMCSPEDIPESKIFSKDLVQYVSWRAFQDVGRAARQKRRLRDKLVPI